MPADADTLRFEPWQSAVDPGFWAELARRKLDNAGLSEDPWLITALYAYRRRVWVVVDGETKDGRTLYRVVGRAFQRQDVAEEEHAALAAALAGRLDAERVDEERVPEGADA